MEDGACELCGLGGAGVAYFASGMIEVVWRHHECDRHHSARELSPSEERQEWAATRRSLARAAAVLRVFNKSGHADHGIPSPR